MDFDEWKPFYDEILEDFGFSREEDIESAHYLDDRLEEFDLEKLSILNGKKVYVAGDGPSLEKELQELEVSDNAVIGADGAAKTLFENGIEPEIVCTDLDGAPRLAADLTRSGTVAVVHAHGDNLEKLKEYFSEPVFEPQNTVGTTQARPFGNLYNFGGFTDGDRSAFLADEFGARKIELIGFDFEDPSVDNMKASKLKWAKRLLKYLEDKRGERFLG